MIDETAGMKRRKIIDEVYALRGATAPYEFFHFCDKPDSVCGVLHPNSNDDGSYCGTCHKIYPRYRNLVMLAKLRGLRNEEAQD